MFLLAKRIMMLDDDASTHVYHRELIEEAGYDLRLVESYTKVDDALFRLKTLISSKAYEELPEVILVDLEMPAKDGWDFMDACEKLDFGVLKPSFYIVTNSESLDDFKRSQEYDAVVEFKSKYLPIEFFESLSGSN